MAAKQFDDYFRAAEKPVCRWPLEQRRTLEGSRETKACSPYCGDSAK